MKVFVHLMNGGFDFYSDAVGIRAEGEETGLTVVGFDDNRVWSKYYGTGQWITYSVSAVDGGICTDAKIYPKDVVFK
jgi:hypothetical protein